MSVRLTAMSLAVLATVSLSAVAGCRSEGPLPIKPGDTAPWLDPSVAASIRPMTRKAPCQAVQSALIDANLAVDLANLAVTDDRTTRAELLQRRDDLIHELKALQAALVQPVVVRADPALAGAAADLLTATIKAVTAITAAGDDPARLKALITFDLVSASSQPLSDLCYDALR